jgi:GNAT superfamily N-acetyltransferase
VGTTESRRADATIRIVPANEAPWDDLRAVFGDRGQAAYCQCQWFKLRGAAFDAASVGERAGMLREQAGCGHRAPDRQADTSGLVAYLDDDPAGWCAVEPRTAYPRLIHGRLVWAGRDERRDDAGVWAVTCFVTRVGYRRRGVSRALAAAAVGFARDHGARAVEGYPLILEPGRTAAWGELFVGSRGVFEAAGLTEVSRPSARRAVMRIDFQGR